MFEDIPMKHLLKLDHPRIDIVYSVLVFRKPPCIDDTVDRTEFSRDVKLKIHIDAVFFQLGDKVVKLLQLHRFYERIKDRIPVLRITMADIMHTHYIDTVSGKLLCQLVRLFMRREASCHTTLSTDETHLHAVCIHKTITVSPYETVNSGRTVIHPGPSADIRYVVRRIMGRLERKHRSKLSGMLNLLQDIGALLSLQITSD